MKQIFVVLIFLSLSQALEAQRCVKGNCQDGFGTVVYSALSRYTGEFRNGKFNGKGIYYYQSGAKYLGEWNLGKRAGEGKWIQANGNIYTGTFAADKPAGQGTMDFKNGDRYVGLWSSDLPNGKGSYYTALGERYVGEFVNGHYEGEGTYYYKDGSVYQGHWKKSKRNGTGELKDKDGKITLGEWVNDVALKIFEEEELIAEEKVELPTSGQTAKPQPEPAPGVTPDVQTIVEETLPDCNNTFCESGKGKLLYADGSKYVGDFVDGEPKGQGICTYANGDRYEGGWEQHAPHGEGVMYFKSGVVYGAMWDHGNAVKQIQNKEDFKYQRKVDVVHDKSVKIWAVVIGIARYEHMPALKYSDDDAYKIYAHLKSPEGGALKDNQIRLLVDEDATRANIIVAMNEIFLKADENDVIMLYYSGHGLEGTFLPIDYDGFKNALHHDEIKEIFNKSMAKHKVCFADACHSGSLLAAKSPFASSLMYFYEELEKSSGGSAFFMSSKSKEFSLEDGGLRQGIFSHFLIKGLKGEADINKDATITIKELYDYVSNNVKTYTAGAQTPLIAGDYDDNMPVGFVRSDN
jgi:hypothetical protein